MSERSARVPGPFGALGTRAGPLAVRFAPGLGGKVTSLRLGPAGREWLAQPARPLRTPAPGQDWGELDCSGWDECLPNTGAAPEQGLADHGDVWRLPWQGSSGPARLSGSVAHGDYRFSRDITTDGPRLRADYTLRNQGGRPLRWAWTQHLLLAADQRTRIVTSSPVRFRLDSAFRHGRPSRGFGWLCPEDVPVTEISLERAAGRAAKLWFVPPLPAAVAVVRGTEWLAWDVADSSYPHLGLWVNLGGWGGTPLRQLALEPSFGCADAPAEAYRELTPLGPGEQHSWHTAIEAGVSPISRNTELFMN